MGIYVFKLLDNAKGLKSKRVVLSIKEESMKRIVLASLMIMSLVVPVWANAGEIHRDNKEIRHDRKDLRQDRKEMRGDRRDIKQDIKDGDKKDLKEDRKDLRQDHRERRRDRRELRSDKRERRHDIRDHKKEEGKTDTTTPTTGNATTP